MNEKEKALEVFDKLFEATESFEPIALQLCYLIPAILRSGYIDINMDCEPERKFHEFLSQTFAKDHFVWEYIKTYTEAT
jgi:hypothetical protein